MNVFVSILKYIEYINILYGFADNLKHYFRLGYKFYLLSI